MHLGSWLLNLALAWAFHYGSLSWTLNWFSLIFSNHPAFLNSNLRVPFWIVGGRALVWEDLCYSIAASFCSWKPEMSLLGLQVVGQMLCGLCRRMHWALSPKVSDLFPRACVDRVRKSYVSLGSSPHNSGEVTSFSLSGKPWLMGGMAGVRDMFKSMSALY